MKRRLSTHHLMVMISAVCVLAFWTAPAAAQTLSDLEGEISGISGQMSAAESNTGTAASVVDRLDKAEGDFAKLASTGKADKSSLIPAYNQLESMLSRIYDTYKKKKDDCIASMDNGGQCDYEESEKISLQAAYPLAWLRFTGASSLFSDNSSQAKRLLNQAIDGFTESTLVIVDPTLVAENLLGRAYCERELGKYDHPEYDKAIADFKQIIETAPGSAQAKAAKQGLATTYMAMGNAGEAEKYTQGQASTGGGQMLQLQALFSAENSTHDAAQKAQYHQRLVDALKSKENDKEGFAIDIAASSKFSQNVVQEFGNSSDPFEKWLLANILLNRHDDSGAAKYFAEAAATGKYPKGYKYAADIYLKQKRYDQVESLLTQIARGSGGDAQWAAEMKFSLARQRWDASGQKDANLENQWVSAANEYLAKFPGGENAPEMRFRLAERLQAQGKDLEAAQMYAQVKGENDYSYTARFNGAECNYKALATAGGKDYKGPKVDLDALRKETVSELQETIKMAPEVERISPANRKKFVHDTRGRAILMLAEILETDPKIDYPQVASLLEGYEGQYPSMSDHFHDVLEWRITALAQMGKYDEVQRDVEALVEKNKGNIAQNDFIKGIGLDFWKNAQADEANGDQKGFLANAKLTATAYSYFSDMVAAGKIPVKNLTGTLSILAQAYQALGEEAKAEQTFNEVVKADPGSPDANAGLARIAQAKGNWKDAVTLWTNVESTAAESDNLWYEAKYNLAVVYVKQNNTPEACNKLAETRATHPTLGSPEMLNRWDSLQKKLCLDHKD
jgi:tetratricopeptide (TPR) repeat protein